MSLGLLSIVRLSRDFPFEQLLPRCPWLKLQSYRDYLSSGSTTSCNNSIVWRSWYHAAGRCSRPQSPRPPCCRQQGSRRCQPCARGNSLWLTRARCPCTTHGTAESAPTHNMHWTLHTSTWVTRLDLSISIKVNPQQLFGVVVVYPSSHCNVFTMKNFVKKNYKNYKNFKSKSLFQ